ncbi:MAG: uroporphyrinogen decarboxylase family protein [Planctomycetota bacterium]
MKPRDIFLAALHRRPVARPATGSATSVVTTDLMEHVGARFPEAHLDPAVMVRLAGAGHTVLGFDNVMPLFSVWHESAALGCRMDWGTPGRMPDGHSPIASFDRPFVPPAGWLDHPACRTPLEALRLLRRELGGTAAVVGKVFGPWTLGYHIYGVEEFLVQTLLNPDAVRAAITVLKEITVTFAQAQIAAGADTICLADHATRDLCGPEAYRDFLRDVHAELAARIPCPLILHICGDTADRIPMIATTGIPCFHFDSKVPAERARQLAGPTLALMGGTGNIAVIRNGKPADVRADVRAKIAAGIDIIGPECAVPLDAPWRNLKALADAVKEG